MFNGKNIISQGKVIFDRVNKRYLDQIDGITWLHSNSLRSYLRDKYSLNPQEYYNLIMYGNISSCPKCFRCGEDCEFIKFSHGYKSRCPSCSIECHNHKDKVYEKGTKSYKESEASKIRVKNGTHNFQTQSRESRLLAQLNSAKNTFISLAKSRNKMKAFMYIGLYPDNSIKIGITMVSIYRRSKASGLKSVHLVLADTPENVADLEFKLKMNFMDKSLSKSEVFNFSDLRSIVNFIKINK